MVSVKHHFEFFRAGASDCVELLQFYKRCREPVKFQVSDRIYYLRQSQVLADVLANKGTHCFSSTGMIVAALRIQNDVNLFFLRSLCISPDYRRQGLAGYLIEQVLMEVKLQPCYCFSYPHLCQLYQAAGFILADIETAKHRIKDRYQRIKRTRNIVYMVTSYR